MQAQPQQQMVADASQYVAQPQPQMHPQQPVQQPHMQARPQYSYNSIFGNQPQPQQAQQEPQSTGKKLPPRFSRFSNSSG